MNASEPTDVKASLELAARLKWLASYSDVEPSKAPDSGEDGAD